MMNQIPLGVSGSPSIQTKQRVQSCVTGMHIITLVDDIRGTHDNGWVGRRQPRPKYTVRAGTARPGAVRMTALDL